MIKTRHRVTLVVVRRCVKPLQERHRGADVPTGLENTMDFGDNPIRILHMLKHRFRDDGVENGVLEWELMPIADDIHIRRGFDFEVDGIGRASIKTGTEIEDFRFLTEMAQDLFHGFIPAGSRVGAPHEDGEKTGLAQAMFYLGDSVSLRGLVGHEEGVV